MALAVSVSVVFGVGGAPGGRAGWGAEAPAQNGDKEKDAAATELVKLAAQQYDQGRFDDALRTLEGARVVSPSPAILYNIGQVERARQDCAGALDAYRGFLAGTSLSDPNRERAMRWEVEMQACLDHKVAAGGGLPVEAAEVVANRHQIAVASQPFRARVTPTALVAGMPDAPAGPVQTVELTAVPTPTRTPTRSRASTPIAARSLIGAGAVAGVAALWFGVRALGLNDDLNNHPRSLTDHNRLQGERDDQVTWATLAGVGGGLLAVAGGYILLVNRQPAAASPSMVLVGWRGVLP